MTQVSGGNLDVHDTLEARARVHGDFSIDAQNSQLLKMCIRSARDGNAWHYLRDYQREALDLICTKIGRILAGNPHHVDHWLDIAGYATLVVNRLSTPPTTPGKLRAISTDECDCAQCQSDLQQPGLMADVRKNGADHRRSA